MLNYLMIGSNDVARARIFYDAVMPVIGGTLDADYMPQTFCYALRGGGRIWIRARGRSMARISMAPMPAIPMATR